MRPGAICARRIPFWREGRGPWTGRVEKDARFRSDVRYKRSDGMGGEMPSLRGVGFRDSPGCTRATRTAENAAPGSTTPPMRLVIRWALAIALTAAAALAG